MSRPTRSPSAFRKFAALALGAFAILLFSGFDMDGHMSTIDVEGPVARSQLNLFYVTLWVTVFIFITVGGTLAYTQYRFRARKTDDDSDPPEQTHGHPVVEVGLIIASTLLLVIIAVPTVRGIWYSYDVPEAERDDALVVKVTGYQWWFKFEYPELGIVTANEMVIPTNRAVHIDLRTIDVIHSFWVPKLAGKVDLIPNRANHMWLKAEKANYYWAQCAEYCGESHANMRFRVISLDEPEWATWVANQQKDARSLATTAADATTAPDQPRVQFVADRPPAVDRGMMDWDSPFAYWQAKQAVPAPSEEDAALVAKGRELFITKTCGGCHQVKGQLGALGITGPDLTHFGSRTTIAAGLIDNTSANLRRWLDEPDVVKPGNLMWKTGNIGKPGGVELTDDELDALVAYLNSLK